jgi:hypothetical protein
MISDYLADAIESIRSCEESHPKYYNAMRPELEVVLTIMEAMRIGLDTPPVSPYLERGDLILKAIREVDISGVTAALATPAVGPVQPIPSAPSANGKS